MKKFLALLSVLVLSMSMLVGCGSKSASNDELVVYFVPSRDPAEILNFRLNLGIASDANG